MSDDQLIRTIHLFVTSDNKNAQFALPLRKIENFSSCE